MLNIELLKKRIREVVVEKLSTVENIISITFVGSFESSNDLSLISDIDIIVILDKLSELKFKEIEKVASEIESKHFDLDAFEIALNMTFGPLKLNNEKTVVFHLMVYDIEGHRKHVIESPFTCLEWENHSASFGKNLKDIYPATGVQLEDLFGSRRSLETYFDDIKNKIISYRVYDFSTAPYSEKKHTFPMDERHTKEYAYHVIKHLILNLLKILSQKNQNYSIVELTRMFSQLSPSFENHSELLTQLHQWKYEKGSEPVQLLERLNFFVNDLTNWLMQLKLPEVYFIRHAKTSLNDGSFLGIRRNPSIDKDIEWNHVVCFDKVYTGSLLRTIETGNLLNCKSFFQDKLLDEIDYGLVEGLSLKDLTDKYPQIVNAWQSNEDPKFPDGESQEDVNIRLNKFLKKGFSNDKIAVVTHNIVLRALLGNVFKQAVHRWHKLNPNHLYPHKFFIFNKELIPAFSVEQRIRYKDELSEFFEPRTKYGIFWIPENKLKDYVKYWKLKIKGLEEQADYLYHPVHATIFLFEAYEKDQTSIISSIKNRKINFKVEGWKLFEKDSITSGETITISLKASEEIYIFQEYIVKTLLSFSINPIKYNNNWMGEFKESYEKYGFPFVGNHWIPHLTVASVKNEGKTLLNEIISTPINIEHPVDGYLALFKIFDETQECVHIWS
jgi:broad specificity phosphatase PhoE